MKYILYNVQIVWKSPHLKFITSPKREVVANFNARGTHTIGFCRVSTRPRQSTRHLSQATACLLKAVKKGPEIFRGGFSTLPTIRSLSRSAVFFPTVTSVHEVRCCRYECATIVPPQVKQSDCKLHSRRGEMWYGLWIWGCYAATETSSSPLWIHGDRFEG